MKKNKLRALVLSLLILVQVFVPGLAWASKGQLTERTNEKLVYIGRLDTKSYPKLDNKTILDIQKQAREKQKTKKWKIGIRLFSADNPYLPGQNPTNEEKAVAYGKVSVKFKTVGLNENGTERKFQWKEIFGEDSNGNSTNAKIHFIQRDAKTRKETGRYTLYVNKGGEYKWIDTFGKEALLPLYSNTLQPYIYEAALDYQISDKVKLLTMELGTTDEKSTFKKDEQGRNVATIPLKLELAQVASTRFSSEWKTDLGEDDRPVVEGLYKTFNKDEKGIDIENLIAFPKNNTDSIQLRNNNYDPENPPDLPYDQASASSFRNVPKVKVVQGLEFANEDDFDGTPTYNIDDEKQIITSLEGGPNKYKFRYNLTYDVIEGGKLTMTEVIPVTFDANGGKFASITDTSAKQEIVKEVDYEGTLTDKAEDPTNEKGDFKGWSETKDGAPLSDEDLKEALKNIKKEKTFYAIYGKAGAKITYLDLNGKNIEDKFKFDGVEYPEEKEGKAGDPIKKDDYSAQTAPKFIGYKFNRVELNPVDAKYGFEKKDTIKLYYEKLDDIIPSTGNEKPDGYVTVSFLEDDNTHAGDQARGSLIGETKFYVNPKAGKTNADLKEPTIKANTGFEVDKTKWDPEFKSDTVITEDKTYTAKYKDGQDVIPVPDPTNPPQKPEGFIRVKFDLDGKGTTSDTKEFYVNPNKEVEITAPTVTGKGNYVQKTGEEAWSPTFATKAKYDRDTTFVAQYTFDKDIIPQKPGEDKPVVPDNYVKVTFKEGEHGIISSSQTTIYWVNPDKEVDLTNVAPEVYAKPEYKYSGWDKALKATFKEATDITALYKKKVVPGKDQPKLPGTNNPDGEYVKVDFVAETHGNIKAGETSTYWVLKDETVELKTPAVEAKTNYAFKEWDSAVKTSYSENTTHKAVFVYTGENVVPQKPNEDKPDVPSDFVKVVFNQGDHGSIDANSITTYWVKPNVKVTVTAPKVTANDDYKHVAWTYGTKEETNLESVTDTFTEQETTITAKYLKKVLDEKPTKDVNSYVKVTFKSETNGKLADDKTEKSYWVLKDTPVTLTEPTVTANTGYKFIKYEPGVQTSYSEDTEHKAQYKEVIVRKDPKDPAYVKVSFDAAKQGRIKEGSNAEVWVLKGETIDPKAITPELEINEKYALEKWDPAVQISYNEDTTHKAIYKYNGENVVPQKPGEDKPNVPSDFVKVTFVAGDNGSIVNTETYIFWVNPNVQVTLNAPEVVANKDYKHMAWTYKLKADDTSEKEVKSIASVTDTFTEKETTITAKYLKKVLTEDPKDKENYVKVTFDKGDNGTIANTETSSYWVLKNTDVTISGPKVTPNNGYTFKEWNPAVKNNYDVDTTHTAQYTSKDKVLTQDPKDSDYIRVIFNANGGKIGADDTKDLWVLKGIATFADAKAKVANPTKLNSTFKGWQDKASEGNTVEDTKVLNADNEIFYAAWMAKGKIIEDPTSETPDPDYVRLTFDATPDGRIDKADGKQTKVIDVLKGTPYTDQDLLDVIGKIKAIPVKDSNGSKIPDANKTFDKWSPSIPETGNVRKQTFVASYKEVDNQFTVKKVWADDVSPVPTMKFTLYRKVEGETEKVVPGAEVKEITKTKTEATWKDLPKTDANGKEYIYSVKETFKDEDVKNANWILGDMVTDSDGNNTITNKLKTVPGENDTPDEKLHRMGKLTITKKIESTPIKKIITMFRSVVNPMEFTFKVTDPYGNVVKVDGKDTFTLKANQTKVLDHLLYGQYTVEETDAKGLTPFVKVGNNDETESNTGKVTLSKDTKEGTVTFINKNVKPSENPNIIEVKATKIWTGGPSKDHTAVDLKLYRQVDGGQKEEVTGVTPVKSRDEKDVSTFNYVWKDLSRINDDGKEYTYSVEEANVIDKKVNVGNNTYEVSQEGNTITNTFVVSKGKIDATKVWDGLKEGEKAPTTYFKLYRKLDDCKECKPVEGVGIKELKAGTTTATWEDQDLTDENGNKYIYSVKEVDENGEDAKPVGFVKKEDGLTVTNTKIAKDGKLTITKMLENEPKRISTFSTRSAAEPIKFKFTITKPDGTSEEFELKAGESKTFTNLSYGKYTVKETQARGYTPYFAIGNEPEKQTSEFDLTISSKDEVNLTVTNKNVINTNDLTVRATKIWVGGLESDHKAVKLQLLRTSAKEGSSEEVVDKAYTLEANEGETSKTITYVWRDLPKHDKEGYKYTYRVKELVDQDGFYTVEGSQNKYKSTIDTDTANTVNETISFKITNTYQAPQTEELIGKKEWKDVPEGTQTPNVKLELWRKTDGGNEEKVVDATALTKGQVNFGKKDKLDKNGDAYTYFVKEVNEDGTAFNNPNYTSIVNGLTVTNTYKTQETKPKYVDVVTYKKWVDVPVGSTKPNVYFQLRRKIDGGEASNVGQRVKVSDQTNAEGLVEVWFRNQEASDSEGHPYIYFVHEVNEEGTVIGDNYIYKAENGDAYMATYSGDCKTITNTFKSKKPEPGPGPEPEPGPQPNPEPEPGPNPNPNPEPNPTPTPEPSPGPSPEPNPNPEPGPGPSPEPNPQPEPEPSPNPEPNPEPKPEPKPGKDPEKPGEGPVENPGVKPNEEKSHEDKDNPKKEEQTPKPNPQKTKEKEKEFIKQTSKKIEKTAQKVIETVGKTVKNGVKGTKSIVKKAFNPQTGVFTNLDIYLGLISASSFGLFITRDKKKDE